MITNNFAQREVRTAAYDEQQTHPRLIVVDLALTICFADELH
jgi:hypothetical protein